MAGIKEIKERAVNGLGKLRSAADTVRNTASAVGGGVSRTAGAVRNAASAVGSGVSMTTGAVRNTASNAKGGWDWLAGKTNNPEHSQAMLFLVLAVGVYYLDIFFLGNGVIM